MNQLLHKSLRVYLLIPVALVFVLIDKSFHFGMLESMPDVPEKWLYFNFIFNVPHIVASNLLLMNSEVSRKFGKKIILALVLAICATFIFYYYLNLKVFIYLHSIWTLKHVILQQFNLGHSLGLQKSVRIEIWKWLAVILGVIIYWDIYKIYQWNEVANYTVVLDSLGLLFLLSSWFVFKSTETQEARLITLANTALIFFSYLLYDYGGALISVLLIRVIHDCTSFIFYHAVNQGKINQGRASRYLTFTERYIGTFLSTILPPIIIVIFLYMLAWRKEVFSLFMVLSIMHYFTEGFMWKAESPHRRYL